MWINSTVGSDFITGLSSCILFNINYPDLCLKCETMYSIVVIVIPNYIKKKNNISCVHIVNVSTLIIDIYYRDACEILRFPSEIKIGHSTNIVTIQNIIKHPTMKNKFLIYYKQKCKIYVINSITTLVHSWITVLFVYSWFLFDIRNGLGLWCFNNISDISWQTVLLVEETRVLTENHQPAASHWQTLSHNVVSSGIQTHVSGYLVFKINSHKSSIYANIYIHNVIVTKYIALWVKQDKPKKLSSCLDEVFIMKTEQWNMISHETGFIYHKLIIKTFNVLT